MLKDFFILALNNIKRRKLRSWLTMLGIFIGIAAVVSLVSLGQGLQASIKEQFESIGANKIFVSPGAGFAPPQAFRDKLTSRDLDAAKDVRGIEIAVGIIDEFVKVKFNGKVQSLPMHSHPTKGEEGKLADEFERFEFEQGRTFKKSGEVVVGYALANDDRIFGKKVKLSDKLNIENKNFEIVGILKSKGNPIEDRHIYTEKTEAEKIVNLKDQFDFIILNVREGENISKVAEEVKEKIRKARDLKKGEEDFTVQTFESIFGAFTNIFNIVQIVVIGIAAISLIVGGIGIANTMYTGVLERTREIGIMKAIGARNSDVLLIFLFESGLLGLAGGIIGEVLGISIGKAVEFVGIQKLGTTLLRASFNLNLIIGTLIFALLIGVISGIFPAKQAASLKPVEALRYQ